MLTTLLEDHSWYSLFKLHWIALFLLLAYLYVKRVIHSKAYEVTRQQIIYFSIAIFLGILLKATPIDVLGKYYLFSAHVLQISFGFFIAVPLLILSFPTDFLRQFMWNHRTRFIVVILSHPWLSLITFNGLLTVYLIPGVYNFLYTQLILNILFQFILFISAFFMWWVIIQPIPEMNTFGPLLRAAYIFFASLALMPIGFFFVIFQKAHFPMFEAVAGTIFPVLTIIYDQQLAGGILKVTQMFTYSCALLFITLEWGRREEEKEGTIDDKNIRYVRGVVIHLDDDK